MKFEISEAQLRRVVDGAITDALKMHPDYLTERGQQKAKNGIAKRVTGALKGFAAQAAEGRREPAERLAAKGTTLSSNERSKVQDCSRVAKLA